MTKVDLICEEIRLQAEMDALNQQLWAVGVLKDRLLRDAFAAPYLRDIPQFVCTLSSQSPPEKPDSVSPS